MLSSMGSDWIVDSGATHHICNNIKHCSEYYPTQSQDNTISIPDGRKVDILHEGTVLLNDNITRKRVFHVPDFHFNLISVHQLCKDMHCEVVFSSNTCMV
ncbi:Retrovirus-related Pol polyprotein from transposon RE2 [Bienertia sinuspersici]